MRTDTAISGFPKIAIHTENLEVIREIVSDDPLVDIASIDLPSMLSAIVIYMVKRQECFFSLATTNAFIAAVLLINSIFEASIC